MKMNFNFLILLSLLTLSIFIGLSTNSILFFWMSIEINMMAFIPLILFLNKYFNDTPIKYFLIQSFSSSLLLFFSLNIYIFSLINYMYMFMIFSIFMKMGFFPFHYWYLNVLMNLSWTNSLFLMTIQKILPFYMLFYLFKLMIYNNMMKYYKNYLNFIIIIGALISLSMIYSSNSMKMILSASSINHMSWMILTALINMKMWVFYFIIYSIILINLINLLNFYQMNFLNELNMNFNYLLKLMIFMLMLMIMSLPPFMGFFIKSFSLYYLITNNFLFTSYILLLISMIMFFYYMKMIIPSMMFFNQNIFLNLINFKDLKYILYLKFILYNFMLSSFLYWIMLKLYLSVSCTKIFEILSNSLLISIKYKKEFYSIVSLWV